jgi:hypothetical protein
VRNHSQSSHLDVEFVVGIFLDGDVLVVAAVVRTDEELVVRITVLLQQKLFVGPIYMNLHLGEVTCDHNFPFTSTLQQTRSVTGQWHMPGTGCARYSSGALSATNSSLMLTSP